MDGLGGGKGGGLETAFGAGAAIGSGAGTGSGLGTAFGQGAIIGAQAAEAAGAEGAGLGRYSSLLQLLPLLGSLGGGGGQGGQAGGGLQAFPSQTPPFQMDLDFFSNPRAVATLGQLLGYDPAELIGSVDQPRQDSQLGDSRY